MNDWTKDADLVLAHPRMSGSAKLISTEEISLAETKDMDIYRIWEIWSKLADGRFAPSRRDIHLDELPTGVLPRVAIIDFVGPPLDFYYRFFGTAMVRASGVELTGKTYYADGITGYGFANAALLPLLIERRAPLFHRVTWRTGKGLMYRTTAIRMPLSDNGEDVTGALTVNHYEAVRPV